MLPLRFHSRWRLAGVALLLAVLAGALLPAWLMPKVPVRTFLELDKWLHGIVFLFLAVWFTGQYARHAYWALGLGLLAFGALIEICQYFTVTRAAEVDDLYADAIGITLGLMIGLGGAGGWSLRMERWWLQRQGAG